jgi:membrane protease YdiL (CAAX protease family)
MSQNDSKQRGAITSVLYYFCTLLVIMIPFWVLGSVTRIHGLPFNMQLNVLLVLVMPVVALYFIARTYGTSSLRRVAIDCLPGHRASNLALAIAFLTVPAAAMLVFSAAHFFVAFDGWSVAFVLVPVYFIVYYFAAAFEEIGWTWYATPILGRKMSIVSTGVTVGVVWAALHTLPWYQQNGWWFMTGMIIFSVLSRIIMTWVYLGNGRLLWLSIAYHAMINTTFTLFHPGSPYANPFLYAIALTPLVIWVLYRASPVMLKRRYATRATR